MPTISPCLWFDTRALEAAQLYISLFPNSEILATANYPEDSGERAGTLLTVEFTLDGQRFQALNGGPEFVFNEAISLSIEVGDQAEVDHYWDGLIANGGEESQCGWLKDPFGVSWQVVPRILGQLLSAQDERAGRVGDALMAMRRIDIAALEAAANGVS